MPISPSQWTENNNIYELTVHDFLITIDANHHAKKLSICFSKNQQTERIPIIETEHNGFDLERLKLESLKRLNGKLLSNRNECYGTIKLLQKKSDKNNAFYGQTFRPCQYFRMFQNSSQNTIDILHQVYFETSFKNRTHLFTRTIDLFSPETTTPTEEQIKTIMQLIEYLNQTRDALIAVLMTSITK